MSDQDPQDPTFGESGEGVGQKAPAESGTENVSGDQETAGGFEDPFGDSSDPFGGSADPFGDADPFGLSTDSTGDTAPSDSGFGAGGLDEAPAASAPGAGSPDEFEVMFEESATPIPKEPVASPAPPASTPDPEPSEPASSGAVTDNDLSAISSFQRSRGRGVIFQSDDVFGGGSPTGASTGQSTPPPPASSSFEPLGNDNPFGADESSGGDTRSSTLDLGRPLEESKDNDDFGDDPFASLGNPLEPEPSTQSSTPDNAGDSSFSSLLSDSGGGAADDPFSQDFAGGGGI